MVITGCTDETAFNYDCSANTDDGSCIAVVNGCTDSLYLEYNPFANTDNGDCMTIIYEGCIDSTAFNYDEYANSDDGSCIYLGCMDETACNYNPEANMADGSCEYADLGYDCDGNFTEYVVGTEAEGGIVFYVDETGQHGLVAALEDLEGYYEWGCFGTTISGADGQAIGTGYQNTLDIASGCSETPIAASEALAYESEGYSDWFLPSKDELIEMYNTIGWGSENGNIGGFVNTWYLSSSEGLNFFSSSSAWFVYFNNGNVGTSHKSNGYLVRVIRSF